MAYLDVSLCDGGIQKRKSVPSNRAEFWEHGKFCSNFPSPNQRESFGLFKVLVENLIQQIRQIRLNSSNALYTVELTMYG